MVKYLLPTLMIQRHCLSFQVISAIGERVLSLTTIKKKTGKFGEVFKN